MQRRRLMGPMPPARSGLAIERVADSDLGWLVQVVVVRLGVQSARTFLQRAIGNPLRVRLVEAQRGEKVGVVRAVEVVHATTGQRTLIRGERCLGSGEPASPFVPDHLVTIKPIVEGPGARQGVLHAADEIILHIPVRSYIRFLPSVFVGDGPVSSGRVDRTATNALQRYGGGQIEVRRAEDEVDADPLRRMLLMFQHVMTTVTDRIDGLDHLIDPLLTESKFLPWLASWVGFELDESLPIHQQRELVRRAIRLYRTRGTRSGVEEMVEVLTAAPVRVLERTRPHPMMLGRAHLAGGEDVVGRYLRGEDAGYYLVDPERHADTDFFVLLLEGRRAFADRFGERAPAVLRRITDVVSHERPAHVAFTLRFDDAH
jgi:phage tail-like protein